MDADGQHRPAEVAKLVAALGDNYVMAVGARSASAHANRGRRFANGLYNKLASLVTGHRISDLTSGFRAVRRYTFPGNSLPAAERILLSDHEHHGLPPRGLPRALRAG